MIKICVYSWLLSALSVVEITSLNIKGRVGGEVEFKCSNWNSWTSVKNNKKYFCHSPCTEDTHIIITAAFKKSKSNGRIQLSNNEDGLFVTFSDLQKSDSGTYYCGVEKWGRDSFIMVNLKVEVAEPSPQKTTSETAITVLTLSFAVTSSSTPSSEGSDVTNMSTPEIINSTLQGLGSVPYLIAGVTVVIIVLMVLLQLMRKLLKKQQNKEDTQEHVEYDEIRLEDLETGSRSAVVSTLNYSADPESLYANYSYHQDTELSAESGDKYPKDVSLNSATSSVVFSAGTCSDSRATDPQSDLVYSVAQLPKAQIEPTGQSESNQSYENDCLYSLAEIPQAT